MDLLVSKKNNQHYRLLIEAHLSAFIRDNRDGLNISRGPGVSCNMLNTTNRTY